MSYTPVLAGLTAALCWGTSDFLSRRQSERVGPYKTVAYSQFITLLVLLGMSPFLGTTLTLPTLPGLALVAAGVLNFIAFIFLYRAFHKGVVSIVAPVAYTYPAVTTVLSIAILGNLLNPIQYAALAGIMLGVILVSMRLSELSSALGGRRAPNLTAGIGSAVGCSLFFGGVYVGVGYAAPSVNLVYPALILRLVGTAAGFLFSPLLHFSVKPTRQDLSPTILTMGILEAVGFLGFTYGVANAVDSLPIVAAISGMGGAIAASYGFALLKERLEWNQFMGVALALLGVFALLYLGG